jgi:hypothetical protein
MEPSNPPEKNRRAETVLMSSVLAKILIISIFSTIVILAFVDDAARNRIQATATPSRALGPGLGRNRFFHRRSRFQISENPAQSANSIKPQPAYY